MPTKTKMNMRKEPFERTMKTRKFQYFEQLERILILVGRWIEFSLWLTKVALSFALSPLWKFNPTLR